MAEFPAFPVFTDAYLGDTTHLTTIEHGAYLLLLFVAWRSTGKCLPDDDDKLAKYARMTRGQWARISPTIREFFVARDGSLYQSRLTDEAKHVRQVREKQSVAGKVSALKRKGRHSTDAQQTFNGCATPSPSPSPTIESDDKSSSPALKPEHVVDAWNEMALRRGLPVVKKLNAARRRALGVRIREHPIDDWMAALDAIERAPWMHGDNDRGWRADFDFLLQPSSFQKLIEGSYDRKQ